MAATPTFDSTFLIAIRQRDPRVVRQLRSHAVPAMTRFIERRGFDSTQASWLAHDVFVDFVYRWADSLDEPRAIERYLRAMCLTAVRRVARRSERLVPITSDDGVKAGQQARLDDALDAQRLGPCLDTLAPRTRQRLQQHYHQAQTMAAIARQEGVSPPAVRKSIVRALAALRHCLGVEE